MALVNSNTTVLDYWYGNLVSEGFFPAEKAEKWFAYSDPNVKLDLVESFPDIIDFAARGMFDRWKETIHGLLALIIVVDQFPRHMFYGKKESFQYDPVAMRLCQWGLARGVDKGFYPLEKLFFYQPLMHSELLANQEKSVELYERLLKNTPAGINLKVANVRNEAVRNYEIIEEFGRFPQRNAVLGRKSTPDELEYLKSLEG